MPYERNAGVDESTLPASGEGIDWATGEALAFGSLLLEAHRVRLSGEDVQRGTFSQRHAVLVDQTNQNEYVPLNNIAGEQARIEIYNSLLSEAGVLGFDYGYSLADPRTLVSTSSLEGAPGEGMLIRPSGPLLLNRITQSRSVCRSMPPTSAASSRDAPSIPPRSPKVCALARHPLPAWQTGEPRRS